MSSDSADAFHEDLPAVGPFTGFGNFLLKEFRDWWKSWRLIIIFALMTLLLTAMVFFGFSNYLKFKQMRMPGAEAPSDQLLATSFMLEVFNIQRGPGLILQIFMIIFSTMGLLTVEKATGTLAWNLSKPLGRTGLLFAKWLAATTMLWLGMCVLPMTIAYTCMSLYHHITPDFDRIAPIVGAACAWIGLWVLLALTISLGFESQAAVAGIIIAFWAVPNLLGVLLGQVIGDESMSWVVDRLATNSPIWAYSLFADKQLYAPWEHAPVWKNIYLYSFAVWTVVLSVLSVRIFNRQEIGA